MIHVVRHAHAGDRRAWRGPDDLRPLTDLGWRQSARIADELAAAGGSLLSSPFTRCMQTLEPLARATGTDVLPERLLAEGSAPEPLLHLIAGLPPGSVLCSHGDVIENLIGHLGANGAVVDSSIATEKGGSWALDVDGGRVRAAVYTPPAVR